jgi:GntR family transcriptional regulator, rspAB operon transcriptional repressor
MKRLRPLSRRRASDAVYEALRNAILSRMFEPGQRLNVHELARQLDVSLTPVKDALARLAAEELVEIRPRSGTFVTAISAEDVAHTFEIRAALESLAAESVVARASDDDIAQIRSLFEAMSVVDGDELEWTEHERRNREFHSWIVRCSGNRKLISMYESLHAHIQIARIHRGETDWRQRLNVEHEEHAAIVRAIEHRNAQAAVRAVRRHLARAADSLVRDLRRQAGAALTPPATSEASAR